MYPSLGSSWEDYVNGKWVLLSEEQAAFRAEHPTAKVHEVWNMEMDPVYVRNVDDAKIEKKDKLERYKNEHIGEFKYNGKLFKVITGHTAQSDWAPGIDTASLFTEINETHAGTYEDPIPYSGNMVLELGKYYSQDGITYKCIRNTGIAVFDTLAKLATVAGGNYAEIANE